MSLLKVCCTPHTEFLNVELRLPNARKILVNGIYRPPDGLVDQALSELDNAALELNLAHSHDVLYLGDMNVDFLTMNLAKRKLLKFLKACNLTQVINRPTRICIGSSTCIDHIYTNNNDLYSHKGILDPGLSDHSMVFITRK